jgi:phenylacetate-CoA ligase
MNFSYNNRNLLEIYFRSPKFARELFAAIYSCKVHNRRFGGVFSNQLEELQTNANLSAEERAIHQLSNLKNMLRYAGVNVPYYRALFEQIGFEPQSMQSLDDLQRIPLLERDILRTRNNDLLSQSFTGPTFIHHTSGTTGTALQFTLSMEANQRHYACVWHHYGWAGIKRGDPVATFGGHPLVDPDSNQPPFWLYDRFENDLFFSIQHISTQTAPLYVQALIDFKPAMIRGIPSFLNLIAQHMLESGKTYRPKAIFTYSETLLDIQRKALEQAFGCSVYNFYSNGERTGHILQCQQGNLHVMTETCVVEVLRQEDSKPASAGEVGDLVITNLINQSMPLIRYKIGDTGVMADGNCSCGRETPILKNLTGRVNDFIVTCDGRQLRPIGVFASTLNVKEAQFIQEEAGSVIVKVVPREGFKLIDNQHIMDELRWDLGNEINIQIQIVDGIPRTKSGKFQHIVSKISA